LYFGVDAIKDRLSVIVEQHGATNEPTINSDQSPHNSTRASNDVLVNGKEDSSSESDSGSDSDSDSASDEGQNEQQSTKEVTQESPKKFTILVDVKDKESTANLS
jgi:hypothetical protein